MSWNVILQKKCFLESWRADSEKQNKLLKHFLGCYVQSGQSSDEMRANQNWVSVSHGTLGNLYQFIQLCFQYPNTHVRMLFIKLSSTINSIIPLKLVSKTCTFLIHSGFLGHIWPSGDPVILLVTKILCRTGFGLYILFFYIDNIIIDAIGQHLVEH